MTSPEMIDYVTEGLGRQTYPLPGKRLPYPDRGNFMVLAGQSGAAEPPDYRRVAAAVEGVLVMARGSVTATPRSPLGGNKPAAGLRTTTV